MKARIDDVMLGLSMQQLQEEVEAFCHVVYAALCFLYTSVL